MAAIALIATGVARVIGTPVAVRASSWFVVCQLALAYFTSGVLKAKTRQWWTGSHLQGVMATDSYGLGVSNVARVYGHRRVFQAASSGVILWESLFPLVLLFPSVLAPLFLLAGIAFHAAAAALMGLNVFFLVLCWDISDRDRPAGGIGLQKQRWCLAVLWRLWLLFPSALFSYLLGAEIMRAWPGYFGKDCQFWVGSRAAGCWPVCGWVIGRLSVLPEA